MKPYTKKTSHSYASLCFKGSFVLLLLFMFCYPEATLAGAKRGLLLWFNTVLPTLLPFIIVSTLIIRLNITNYICRFLYPIIGKLFHVSTNGCYPIMIGFLSGIPMGAKTSADLVREQKISIKEGEFLTILCNNASPVFILSYIALSELNLPNQKGILVALLYGSAILTACLYRSLSNAFVKRKAKQAGHDILLHSQSMKTPLNTNNTPTRLDFSIVDRSIMDGFEVITKVGGYIILFSIVAQILLSLVPANHPAQLFFVGIFEITLGIDTIANSTFSSATKIVLILTITSFGGFSGLAQTKSVIANSGLSIKSYTKAKLLNACITLVLSFLYVKIFLHL